MIVTKSHKNWLKKNHKKLPYDAQAEKLGCHPDTLKRILVRLELQEFDGAKYAVKRDANLKTWTKPCLKCGDKTTRPKNYYYCLPCRKKMGYEE